MVMNAIRWAFMGDLSGTVLMAGTSAALSPYVVVARGSEGLIRTFDEKVRDVNASIPAVP